MQVIQVEVQGENTHLIEKRKVKFVSHNPMTIIRTDKQIYNPGQTGIFALYQLQCSPAAFMQIFLYLPQFYSSIQDFHSGPKFKTSWWNSRLQFSFYFWIFEKKAWPWLDLIGRVCMWTFTQIYLKCGLGPQECYANLNYCYLFTSTVQTHISAGNISCFPPSTNTFLVHKYSCYYYANALS